MCVCVCACVCVCVCVCACVSTFDLCILQSVRGELSQYVSEVTVTEHLIQ